MNFWSKFKEAREYESLFQAMLADVKVAYMVPYASLDYFSKTKEEAFISYTELMDVSEQYWHKANKLVDSTIKYADITSYMAQMDAMNFAKTYEECAKKIAFLCLALASVGGFQPIRSREMLENKLTPYEVKKK